MKKRRSPVIAVGFTDAQRRWFLERDGHRCQMHYVVNGKWVRCPNTARLQIHHRIPRGWASHLYPHDYPINGAGNGIALCEFHHIARGMTELQLSMAVHQDNFYAQIAYSKGNKNAFREMIDGRRRLMLKGQPYWHTRFDVMFERIIHRENARFIRGKPYPKHRKYGVRGR